MVLKYHILKEIIFQDVYKYQERLYQFHPLVVALTMAKKALHIYSVRRQEHEEYRHDIAFYFVLVQLINAEEQDHNEQ
eukprot:CAMPEP_0197359862 /NCGR_PEP_ID=MMETSP0893-20130614/59755_1 /TAXON_ID=44058 ORGANISM="Aureoumbra lagunensis, Strain CCMP1510" /NCGR_SAMPLE_ID=MMETSP0893 /ASSEMBLY_ACC=CAM_ASM_000539 /LENGTH=77 /DNA_ID=CAMNT_0042880283 /DNA_START=1 /DNA_END=237 /DNA_ORIENTATION=-